MHCNLRPPEPRQPFPALITTPCQVWSRWTYPLPYYGVFAADTLLYAVTLTFDFWPWIFAAYPLWRIETLTKFERNHVIHGGVIAILVFDLMTLNIAFRVGIDSGIIFTKFDLWQLKRAWIISFFDADALCHAVTLTFVLSTLNFYSTSGVLFKLHTKFDRNIIIHGWVIDDLARFRVQF